MPWKNKEAQKAYAKAYHQKKKNDPNYRATRKKNFLKYVENNKDVVSKINSRSYFKNKPKRREYYREWDKQQTVKLSDGYMREHLRKLGYSMEDVKKYPELIESHRIIIKTKRLWKKSQTSPN